LWREAKKAWIVGYEPTEEDKSLLKGRECEAYVISTPSSSKSGAKTLMESPIGKKMAASGEWDALSECAALSDILRESRTESRSWGNARAVEAAVLTYFKKPWNSAPECLAEWKLLFQSVEALDNLKEVGLSMIDFDDSMLQQQMYSMGGVLEFAGRRWICVNGRCPRLKGRDIVPPKSAKDCDGTISWQWCARTNSWRLMFESEEADDSVECAVSSCQGVMQPSSKPFLIKGRFAVVYAITLPFQMDAIKYFWKF